MKTKNILLAILVVVSYTALISFAIKEDDTSPGKNEISIEEMTFNPPVLMVSENTTITWTNNEGVPHTVTSDEGLFDSGNIAPKATYTYTFTKAGMYVYHCSIHPDMTGRIVVQEAASN